MLSYVPSRLPCTLALALALAACTEGAQVVAKKGDGGASLGGCPWQSEGRLEPAPIHHVNGGPSHFAVAFDAQKREFIFLFKPDSRSRSTQLLLQRFSEMGSAIAAPMEVQTELPYDGLAWRWDHHIAGLISTGSEHLAIWSQRKSPVPGVVQSELWLQRIQQGSALGAPQKLLDLRFYFDAFAVTYVGGQLIVAFVEDTMTTAPNMTLAPIIRLRRFDSAFAPLGEALDIPLPAPDGPFSQVLAMQLEGDESHLGLLVSRYGSAGSDTRFALIAGSEVVALSDALSSGTSTAAGGTLAYGGGYFLRCSGAPSQCHLIEAAGADAVGRPVPFSPPGADVVNAILWHQGRFFVGASSGDDAPAQRVLGWIDVAGQWGHQQVWSDDSRVLGGAATTKLLLGRSDEIFWIDDALSAGGLEEMDVLLRIARSCP